MTAIRSLLVIAFALCLGPSLLANVGVAQDNKAHAAAFTGHYFGPKEDGIVRVYLGKNGKLYGKIVWEKKPGGHLGHQILKDFRWVDKQWRDGRVCPPEKNRCLSARLEQDTTGLKVHGKMLLFSKTVTLKRVTKHNAPANFRPRT